MSIRMIRWLFWPAAVLVVIGTTYMVWKYSKPRRGNQEVHAAVNKGQQAPSGEEDDVPLPPGPVHVKVVYPRLGALLRITTQNGTVEAYEVMLHSQVSGLLKPHILNNKIVDIGTVVKKGDVVAVIDVPDLEKSFERASAVVEQTKARVTQMKAKVKVAKADLESANAQIVYSQANARASAAWLLFRKLQKERMVALAKSDSIEEKLVEEAKERYEAARESENAANAAIVTAKANLASADAKIILAEADVSEAEAQVKVAEADMGKAKVQLDFASIKAPFNGIITQRNFYQGAFVRSASEKGVPQWLFAIQRTDLMRVVVQIPDRDVPFADPGDTAVVEINAIPGKKFPATVSLIAKTEDPRTRLMPVEIHLLNPDPRIRQGMFGNVTIVLDKLEKQKSIPTACLVGKAADGQGTVFVVGADGKPKRRPIEIGVDDGKRVEVLKGLELDEQVLLSAPRSLTEDTELNITTFDESKQEHP